MGTTNSSTRITSSTPKSASDSARAEIPLSPTPKPMPIIGDQPTVISNRPPLPVPSASDSAHRILEGRIMPGDHLGHFELLDYVGGGGMGRVFKASDTRLARTVALKVLSPEQAADYETVQRFQNEAQSAARLDHDNIARVHYVGEDRGIHFIAFEFVEGVNIRVLVEQRGPLPLDEAVSYTLQVAEALAHADARSVVHRDIKPSNIIITPEGRVKLIDMGLARLRQLDSTAADLTASGVTLGTFDYISPEQARDPRNADTRSDIYSLGCTLFFMLTGRPPFLEGTVLQKLLQHQSEEPPEVREFRADLPEEIDIVLKKMLAKDPQDRFHDAGELAYDLLAISERLGLQSPLSGSRAWLAGVESKPSFWHRHLPWMASIAALVSIVLALEIYWTITATPVNLQNPPSLSAEDYVSELPFPKDYSVSQSPANSSGKEKPSLQKTPSGKTELESPAYVPPKLEQNADLSLRTGEATSGRANLNFDSLGNSSAHIDDTGISPNFSSTAETLFRGKNVEIGQPFAGAMGLTPPKNTFPLNSVDVSPSPWSISPSNVAGSLTNADGLPAKFGSNAPSQESPAKRTGLLVVCEAPSGENEFTSLSAACAMAHNGDIIELCFNGPREVKPIRIPSLQLTIRAGKGFSPTLVFLPREPDPDKYPRGMITLSSGCLNLTNLSFKLIVPPDILTEKWSLFEIHGGQTVQLDRCALTIENATAQGAANHPDTAFFRVCLAPETEFVRDIAPPNVLTSVSLDLFNTLARGEAVFLRAEDSQPAHLNWDNGLLITSEPFLFATGGIKEPKSGEMLQLTLRHVTAAMRGGLCRLTASPAAPCGLAVQMNCADNIFLCPTSIPLIQQDGIGTIDNLRRKIKWNGDLNCYDLGNVFWSIRRSSGELPIDMMDFARWLSHWGPSHENQPRYGKVHWNRPSDFNLPAHLQTAFDYVLNRTHPENPAMGAASDASDAGVQAKLLPPTP